MVLANIALLWAASRIVRLRGQTRWRSPAIWDFAYKVEQVYVTHDYTLDSSEKHAAYLRRMRTLSWSAIVCVLTYIFIEHIRSFTIRASKYNGSPTRTSAAWILATTAAPVTAEVMLLATAFGLRRLLPPPSVRSWGTGYDWVKLKFWRGSSFRLEEEMPVTHPIAHFLWLMVKYDRHSHPLVLARWVAEACMFHGRSG